MLLLGRSKRCLALFLLVCFGHGSSLEASEVASAIDSVLNLIRCFAPLVFGSDQKITEGSAGETH